MDLSKLNSEDYLTKARAFVELTWEEKREDILPVLRNFICKETEDEWRLRSLEVLAVWNAREEIQLLRQLYNDRDPIVLRGYLWLIASIGEVKDILDMLFFAASPKGRIINPETVLNLLTQAIQKGKISINDIQAYATNKPNILRYIADWDFADETPRLLTVYPSADYFALICKDKGIPFKQYKKINYKNLV